MPPQRVDEELTPAVIFTRNRQGVERAGGRQHNRARCYSGYYCKADGDTGSETLQRISDAERGTAGKNPEGRPKRDPGCGGSAGRKIAGGVADRGKREQQQQSGSR